MIELNAMNELEYEKFMSFTLKEYAHEKIIAGTWLPENAESRAFEDMHRILPDGYLTPDAYFYNLIDSSAGVGQVVGFIWFNIYLRNGVREAFLYDIHIAEEYQGKGYGTQTMELLEREARKFHAERIGLHVFGHNDRAKRLYMKMGYDTKSITMYKEL
ncbi:MULTISPECIES: GNAT family N-acetyltransferase [unclassified Paenibacillus]|uniref:GNAT family N-acetyltransferase n=1 Tax=Paenibacillus provencensis TaxID=441151 RepID=A0ABW3Q3F9_9BACL|nr:MULTISPECIES: GNAT family N-acetyltransferase [unclassified Paenibacillus]MCM3128349.1 GNAT family N-acetyltransferase [Paenibacillus sp. MER 78]SFS86056.1 Acetyltransferase (GNAT) family protein [Paenibacillus sp. 453mf]